MPLINVPVGIAPCQIDDFPEKVGEGKDKRPFERSCKGAMYFRPASTKVITNDELTWLQESKAHKGSMLSKRLHVVRVDIVTDKSDRSKAELPAKSQTKAAATEPAKAEPPAKPSAEAEEAESGLFGGRSGKRGRGKS